MADAIARHSLKRIVLDELHALVTSKRGDLLSLGLARLWRLAPDLVVTGLSATVAEPVDTDTAAAPASDTVTVRTAFEIPGHFTGSGSRGGRGPPGSCSTGRSCAR